MNRLGDNQASEIDLPYPYPYQNPGGPGQTMSAVDFLSILRRRFILILSVVIGMTALSWLIASHLTPQYQANALVLLDDAETEIVAEETAPVGNDHINTFIETQLRVLHSRSFAETVVTTLDLTKTAAFNPSLRAEQVVEKGLITKAVDGAADFVSSIGSWKLLAATGDEEPEDQTSAAAPPERVLSKSEEEEVASAISILLGGLKVSREGQSSVISIGYKSPVPGLSAHMANKVARIYVQNLLTRKQASADRTSAWLKERVDELRQRAVESENRIASYRAENKLVKATRLSLDDQQIANLSSEMIKTKALVAGQRAKLDLIQKASQNQSELASISEVINSPVIGALRGEELRLLREEAQLRQEYGQRHPKIIEIQAQKNDLAAKINLELIAIAGVVENELAIAERRYATLEQAMQEASGELNVRDQAEVQLNELQREANADLALYNTFLNRYKELSERRDLVHAGAKIISNAVVPGAPSFPQPRLIIAVGFTTSLVFGALAALVRESLEKSLRSAKQIEDVIGLTTYGTVPNIADTQHYGYLHRYLYEKPKSSYAEAVRNIWVSLKLAQGGDMPRIWMITSSLPNEGKTTLSTSLATSLATGCGRTVLIDLDLRNPSVAKDLGIAPTTGVLEHLVGEVPLEDVIIKDPAIPNLDIIPVCEMPPNPIDLLVSSGLKTFLERLREEYEFIIIDSPPVLGLTDTKLTAQLADLVLLAIRWGSTDSSIALNAIDILSKANIPIEGAILTRVNFKRHSQLAYGDAAQYYKKYERYYVD